MKSPRTTIRFSRLAFVRAQIEPLEAEDLFRIETPTGSFEMSKAQFYETFHNVTASRSYRVGGLYHYKTVPSKAEQFRTDGTPTCVAKKRNAFALPSAIQTMCTEAAYKRWLHRKAVAHVNRDRKRWNLPLSVPAYKAAIHSAVVAGGERDAYTGDLLDWSLISTYDNSQSKKGGTVYKKRFALLPTVDHAGDTPGDMNFKICAWRTNDAKSDMSLLELIELCAKVLTHHGKKVPR